jgi:hypothetical protein
MEMDVKIDLPQEIEVFDYHEFNYVQDALRKVISGIKVKEVGFNGKYLGMIYIGSLKNDENKKMVAKIQERSDSYKP